MRKLYTFIQWLSLDVALGALASGGMVAWLLNVSMPLSWWIGLPLAVWIVYTLDHLLDARRLKEKASTARHLFHYTYQKVLLPIVILLSLVGIGLAFYLPLAILYAGLGIAAFVVLHLLLVKLVGDRTSLFFHKELGVGVIFSLGIWAGPWVMADYAALRPEAWLFCQYFILVMINLLMFSKYELITDERDGHTSSVRALGHRWTLRIITGLSIIIIAIGACLIFFSPLTEKLVGVQGIYLLMLTILVWISYHPTLFEPKEAYRLWGDLAFVFPALYLFL
ncbi:MAG: hypothetical protein AAFO96_09665 [Bacteroidota bacterium]